jgi:MFS family permease
VDLSFKDIILLLHPAIAIVVLFPLLGILVNRALSVRRHRQNSQKEGTTISTVGAEHANLGKYLAAVVVGIALLGMLRPIFAQLADTDAWHKNPFQAGSIVLMYGATIASFACIYRANQRHWRAIFAALSSMGLIILGCQDGVFRRDAEWFVSHFYYGIGASILMICAVTMFPEIYLDRTNRWRNTHIIFNCLALLLFIGQGLTGARDLLELPLSWQESYVFQCDFVKHVCSPLSK